MRTASGRGGGRGGERAGAEPESLDRVHDDRGRILRDNVYGTIDQDVWRRDFTCNALYYNIEDFSIWDYVGGVEDIRARTIRLIGDPETRYREDPVRMLRAVRFEAKLGFTIHETARAPFATLARTARAHPAGAAARRIPEALPRRLRPAFLRTAARARPLRAPVSGDRGSSRKRARMAWRSR